MLDFIKMEATGNDYIYIDCFKNDISIIKNLRETIVNMCNRNYGIGSDGVILICPSKIADAKMIMYNIDGSEGHMCGNGIRCVAKYVYENILQKSTLEVETKSGLKNIILNIENEEIKDISVNMAKPVFITSEVPVISDKQLFINEKITVNDSDYEVTCISMGNPHTIIFCDEVDSLDLNSIGKCIENYEIFPDRTNVEFVQIIDSENIKIRVWERGCGETLSCGTGACACVVAGVINNYLSNNEVKVHLNGGILYIKYDDEVMLRGSASNVFYGTYLIK